MRRRTEFQVVSDDYSNHNLPVGAIVTPVEAPDWSGDEVTWYTQGIDGDEVAIDPRDLREVSDERGAAAVEYALLAVGIAAACIFALAVIQQLLGAIFQQTADNLEGDYVPNGSVTDIASPVADPTGSPTPTITMPPCAPHCAK